MPQAVNVLSNYDLTTKRELIFNTISNLTPDETPFLSTIGTESIDSYHPEWFKDELRAPSLNNARVDGYEYEYENPAQAVKLGNYAQISDDNFKISERAEKNKKAGPQSEVGRQARKSAQQLKIDVEVTALSNQASLAGDDTTPGRSAGARAWIATNDLMGSGGASGGFNTGTGLVAAATNGTQRAMTLALLREGIKASYESGGDPNMVMLSPYLKQVFSSFMSDASVAPFRKEIDGKRQGTIVGAADFFVSDFGGFAIVPNRQMGRYGAAVARNAFILDKSKWKIGMFRPYRQDNDVAKTGDYIPKVLKVDWTLISRNEAASAVIADLYGMSASS